MAKKDTSTEKKALPTSVRFPTDVNEKLEELTTIFEESTTKVLTRAIGMLYENRLKVVEEEAVRKIKKAKGEAE